MLRSMGIQKKCAGSRNTYSPPKRNDPNHAEDKLTENSQLLSPSRGRLVGNIKSAEHLYFAEHTK